MPEPAEMSRSPEDPRKTPGSTEGGGSSMAVGSSGGGGGGESGEGNVNVRKAGGGGGEADPFADYMWMENEEEYNRQVEEELLEQDFLERCFQEMLEEEEHDWFIPSRDYRPGAAGQIQNHFNGLSLADGSPEDIAQKSNLNPEAREFVPGVKY